MIRDKVRDGANGLSSKHCMVKFMNCIAAEDTLGDECMRDVVPRKYMTWHIIFCIGRGTWHWLGAPGM